MPASPPNPVPPFDAYVGGEPFVFVSYSHKDSAVVFTEIEFLHSVGCRIWYDEGIEPGSNWAARIEEALAQCAFFVVFVSRQSIDSSEVRNEINYALNHGKSILPIFLEKTPLKHGLDMRMGNIQSLYRYEMEMERYRRKLCGALPEALTDTGTISDGSTDSASGSYFSRRTLPPSTTTDIVIDPKRDYLLELTPGGEFRPIPLRRSYCSIGRTQGMVRLQDKKVSRKHVVLARVGSRWVAVNVSKTNSMTVAGWPLQQKTLVHGDVIRIGNTHLVYMEGPERDRFVTTTSMEKYYPPVTPKDEDACEEESTDPEMTDDDPEMRDDDDDAVGSCVVAWPGGTPTTDSVDRPLLIGSHPGCHVCVHGKGVAAVHCFVGWRPDGLCLFDLDSGFGTIVAGKPIKARILRGEQRIKLGEHELTIEVLGNPLAPAKARGPSSAHAMAICAIHGPHSDQVCTIYPGEPKTLGSAPPADFILAQDANLAPRHVRFDARTDDGGLVLVVENLNDDRPTKINNTAINGPAVANIGDLIHFNAEDSVRGTVLFLHYGLHFDAW